MWQKIGFKKAINLNTSNLAAKSDLASLKAEVDKIDIIKLKAIPVDLSKLSDVVNNDVVKAECIWLIGHKVNCYC